MKFQKRGLPLLGAMAVAVGSLLAWGAQPAQANSESRGDGPAEIGSCGADIGHIVKFTIQGTTGRVAQDTGNETKYALEWTESGGYLNVVAIWWDTNNDGVHDATEPSAPFSRLRLYLGGEDAHDYPFEPAATTAHLGPFGDANITHVLACMADVGYLRIMKIWETTSEVVPPRSEPPRYDLVCRNEAYPGGASTLTAKTEVEVEGTAILPGSTCTVREVAVPNNGWIEDPDACEFTFAAAETGISGPAPQIAPEMSFVNTAWWLTKTAVATKTVSYPWTLTKVASPTGLNLAQGTTGEITYTLTPVRGELAENSNLSGAVTVGGIRADLLKQVTVVDNDTVLACNSEGLCAYTFRLKPGVVEGTNSAHATYTNGLDVESLEVSTPFEVTPSTAPITPKLVDAFNGGVAVTVAELGGGGGGRPVGPRPPTSAPSPAGPHRPVRRSSPTARRSPIRTSPRCSRATSCSRPRRPT